MPVFKLLQLKRSVLFRQRLLQFMKVRKSLSVGI